MWWAVIRYRGRDGGEVDRKRRVEMQDEARERKRMQLSLGNCGEGRFWTSVWASHAGDVPSGIASTALAMDKQARARCQEEPPREHSTSEAWR
jgi:hypothetical protein